MHLFFISSKVSFILLISTGMAVHLVINVETGFKSTAIAFLSDLIASIAVTPEPEKGSNTISPSFV